MKKTIIAALLFISLETSAQVIIETESADSIQQMVQAITKASGYPDAMIDTAKCRSCLQYISTSADGNQLRIFYYKANRKGNADLNQPDTGYYGLGAITGSLKELFPLWKKQFDSEADYEKTAIAGNGKVVDLGKNKRIVATLNKSGKLWQISVQRY